MTFARKDRNISLGVFLMFFLGFFLIGFIVYMVAENQKYFEKKYSLYMHLPNAQGLNSGAFVALSGLKIGVVGKMQLNTEIERLGIITEIKIGEEYQEYITTSSVAMIKTMGILGDKYVDITIGKPGEETLQAGNFIKSDPGIDPYEFMDDAAKMVTELKKTLYNIEVLTSEATAGKGIVGKLFKDPASEAKFDRLLANTERISDGLAKGKGSLGRILQDTTLYVRLNNSAENFQAILDSMHNGKGAFAQLLADTAFYPRLRAMAVKTDSLLYRLQHGGTVAKLLNDEQLYQNLVNLTRSLDSLSTDIKKNPGRYVQVKVF
jgi:phospholipid/cholesterol/gamma-HCH transport system substrate-binding protein